MRLLAILTDTFREALARKTILGFFIISTFFLIVGLIFFLAGRDLLFNQPKSATGVVIQMSHDDILRGMETVIARLLYGPAILLSVFATASIIPNTLEKGAIDLLLSKPVSRTEILIGKFLGGSLMVFLNVAYFLIGMWIIIGLTLGFWEGGILASILPITFSFLVLYALVIFLGVLSRSSALSIILTYFLFIIIIPVLTARQQIFQFVQNSVVQGVITTLYYIFPKTDDIPVISSALINRQPIDWMPVWSSALFAIASFVGAIVLFRRKDF